MRNREREIDQIEVKLFTLNQCVAQTSKVTLDVAFILARISLCWCVWVLQYILQYRGGEVYGGERMKGEGRGE